MLPWRSPVYHSFILFPINPHSLVIPDLHGGGCAESHRLGTLNLKLLARAGVTATSGLGHLLLEGAKVAEAYLLGALENLVSHCIREGAEHRLDILLGHTGLILEKRDEIGLADNLRTQEKSEHSRVSLAYDSRVRTNKALYL